MTPIELDSNFVDPVLNLPKSQFQGNYWTLTRVWLLDQQLDSTRKIIICNSTRVKPGTLCIAPKCSLLSEQNLVRGVYKLCSNDFFKLMYCSTSIRFLDISYDYLLSHLTMDFLYRSRLPSETLGFNLVRKRNLKLTEFYKTRDSAFIS